MPLDLNVQGSSHPDLLRYPQNVGSSEQPHSVVFYINAREGSTNVPGLNDPIRSTTAWKNSQIQLDEQYTLENRISAEKSGELVAGAGGVLGAAAGAKLAGSLTPGSNLIGKTVSFVGGAGLGAAVGVAVGKQIGQKYNTVRLTTAIQLHVSQSLVSAYSANWNEESLGTLTGMIAQGRFSMADIADTASEGFGFAARSALIAAASLPKAMGLNEDFGSGVEASEKRVANPYREQLFKSMGFRKFTFNYEFAPRNYAEYTQVQKIILAFKANMHPDMSDGQFYLTYPGEFNIEYRYGTKKNSHVSQVSSCALTDMKVTYGADGVFNTFEGTDGAPTEMQMQLSFTELEVLTSKRVKDGGL